jgi:hypothetical protein
MINAIMEKRAIMRAGVLSQRVFLIKTSAKIGHTPLTVTSPATA